MHFTVLYGLVLLCISDDTLMYGLVILPTPVPGFDLKFSIVLSSL